MGDPPLKKRGIAQGTSGGALCQQLTKRAGYPYGVSVKAVTRKWVLFLKLTPTFPEALLNFS